MSCKTQSLTQTQTTLVHDTTTIVQRDTVTHIINNNVYHHVKDTTSQTVNTFTHGDTVFVEKTIYRERENIIYRDRTDSTSAHTYEMLKHIVDSISDKNKVTVVEPQKTIFHRIRDSLGNIALFICVIAISLYILTHTKKEEH